LSACSSKLRLLYCGDVSERSFFLLTTNRFSPFLIGIISGTFSLEVTLVTSFMLSSSATFLDHFSAVSDDSIPYWLSGKGTVRFSMELSASSFIWSSKFPSSLLLCGLANISAGRGTNGTGSTLLSWSVDFFRASPVPG